MKFEHLGGGSHDHFGKIITKGMVIETHIDLEKQFPGKYKRTGLVEAAVTSDAPENAESVETSEPAPKKGQDKGKGAPARKTSVVKPDAVASARGIDVTKKFPRALDEGFFVFQRGDLFHVFEDEKSTTPVNEKGLKASEVDAFVKKALES